MRARPRPLGVLGLALYTFGGDGPAFDIVGGGLGAGAPSAQGRRSYDVSWLMPEAPRIWEQVFSERMARIKGVR